MRKIHVALAGAAATLLLPLLPGCGGGGDKEPTVFTPANEADGSPYNPNGTLLKDYLLGIWNQISVSANGREQACPGDLGLSLEADNATRDYCDADATITFRADGTFRQTSDTGPGTIPYYREGTYFQVGSTLTKNVLAAGDDVNQNGQLEPDEMVTGETPRTETSTVTLTGGNAAFEDAATLPLSGGGTVVVIGKFQRQ